MGTVHYKPQIISALKSGDDKAAVKLLAEWYSREKENCFKEHLYWRAMAIVHLRRGNVAEALWNLMKIEEN